MATLEHETEMQRNFSPASFNLTQAEGFVCGAVSGLVTGLAAGNDVFSFINLLDRPVIVTGVRLRFVTTTAFSSAQCMAFRVNKVTGFSAQHSAGGTSVQAHYLYQAGVAVTNAGTPVATGDRIPTTEINGYIAATGAISGGTYTAEDTDEPEQFAVGAGSTLPVVVDDWLPTQGLLPLVLPKNSGIVVNNQIAMGSSGVGNLFVGIDGWRIA